jgi:hypothetical protein
VAVARAVSKAEEWPSRPQPAIASFEVEWTAAQLRILQSLCRTGMFGRTLEQVVENLVMERARELVLEGWIDRDPQTLKPTAVARPRSTTKRRR